MNTFIFWHREILLIFTCYLCILPLYWIYHFLLGFGGAIRVLYVSSNHVAHNRHLLVFLSGYHTFSLPRLVAPAMTSTRMLESTGIDISAPDLWEKAYDSSLCMLIVGLSSVISIVLRCISHTYWGFIEKRSWILSNVFFYLTWLHGFCPPNCQCDASYLLICIYSAVLVSQE